MKLLSQMNEIVESVEENLFFCTFFMFWSAKVVLLIDSLWHHHHHKRWEPLWVRRKSICHLFPIIKTFGSFIVLCGGYFCLPNKHKILILSSHYFLNFSTDLLVKPDGQMILKIASLHKVWNIFHISKKRCQIPPLITILLREDAEGIYLAPLFGGMKNKLCFLK